MHTSSKPPQARALRYLRSRPRLWGSALVGLLVGWLLPESFAAHALTRGLIGWNVGAALYLTLMFVMMARATPARIRTRAAREDEGQYIILLLVCAATIAVLIAIAVQLADARQTHGSLKTFHVSLAAATVITAWLFTQSIFALHYAHEYYRPRKSGAAPLTFPGDGEPDYFDFLYAACIIGTSGQTADVSFASSHMRRVGLVHCVLAFFFNTTLLALTINVAAGLF